MRFCWSLIVCVIACLVPVTAGERVLVAFRQADPASRELAEHYVKVRGVETTGLLALDCTASEVVERVVYEKTIAGVVRHALIERDWLADDQSVFIVLIRGVPLRIAASNVSVARRTRTEHRENDAASVDSELAALGIGELSVTGSVPNPAFVGEGDDPRRPKLIVGRIDGPDWASARRLIDDAVAVENSRESKGTALIDHAGMEARMGEEYRRGDQWLEFLERRFAQAGFTVKAYRENALLDRSDANDVFFYAGWYSPHVSGFAKDEGFRFRRGAVVCHIHSLSAQTVRSKSQRWVGPLVARGAAVVLGNVDEPFLSYSTHLDRFFDHVLAGDCVGEAMWKATPRLSWMNVMVGDPLYRPFAPAESDE